MNKTQKNTLQSGINTIKGYAKNLPLTPGVYQMLDAFGQTLYVGKAKALKRRVLSYTQPNRLSSRIMNMVSATVSMIFIETHTEAEALLLEANLIKKKKPKFNILLRDDKSFPYIFLSQEHEFPRLYKHRGARVKKGEYFGPYANVKAVNHTIDTLQRVFMIRNCKDSDFATRERPCLQYHIKRCSAPCVGYVTKEEYKEQIKDAMDYLRGKSLVVQERFAQQMERASQNMEYEKAALYRDRIRALSQIQSKQSINFPDLPDCDVVSAIMHGDKACVQIFFFRNGQSLGNHSYYPQISSDDNISTLMSHFTAQFYRSRPIPKELILSHVAENPEILTEALSQYAGYKIELKTNVRGARKQLLDWAGRNLKSDFERYLAAASADKDALDDIAQIFDMPTPPQRIEIYDNSHTSGQNMVGAMVVASPDGFEKGQYRKFNIKHANAQDDFDMMREVMQRRFKRALDENQGPGSQSWPDLLLIDGGKGQLSAVTDVLKELNILDKLSLVAISKGPDRNAGREEFHMNGKTSFRLPEKTPTLFYLQRLRDEAHRFAIGSHRTRRAKTTSKSELDDIPGIGGKRKKALLLHFGSAKNIESAGIGDLIKVDGISEAIAQTIYNYFHEK